MAARQNNKDARCKRPRDVMESRSSFAGGSDEEQDAKRRRVVAAGFGLGAFAGLVGKALKATVSAFGRGGQQRR